MREIKFRAWDNEKNRMIYLYEENGTEIDMYTLILWNGSYQIEFYNHEDDKKYYDSNQMELMQFTGLLDKNGVGIYEGDILFVEVYLFGGGENVEVYYEDGSFKTGGKKTEFIQMALSDELDEFKCEVIGNIYENKELLEAT